MGRTPNNFNVKGWIHAVKESRELVRKNGGSYIYIFWLFAVTNSFVYLSQVVATHFEFICTTHKQAKGDEEVVIGMQYKVSWSQMHKSKRGGYALTSFERFHEIVQKNGKKKVRICLIDWIIDLIDWWIDWIILFDRCARKYITWWSR